MERRAPPTSHAPSAFEDGLELELVGDELLARAAIVDRLDYFDVLELDRPEGDHLEPSLVRAAFHRFALAYHPDRVRGEAEDVRAAATKVYVAGAEGYRVLLDPLLRRRYLRQLREEGRVRIAPEVLNLASHSGKPGRRAFVDVVRSAAAEPFARKADELRERGALAEAHLQLRLASLKEGKNALLEEMMLKLADELAAAGR
jgi:curved DNA-binding protein CbpA